MLKAVALFLLFGSGGLQAQEAILSSGGEALGGGGSVSYSVGQVVYTINTGINGSVAQGVQQPYEISNVGIEQHEGIKLECIVYPNPVNEFIKLKVESYKVENLSYQLFDVEGRLLESEKVTGNETKIKMTNLLPANYFLKVMENQKLVKTFKIIKN